jgi:hypothetical protein
MNPPAEVGGFLQKILTSILGGQWWIAASIVLMLVVWYLRREEGGLVQRFPVLGTRLGGWIFAFTVAFLASVADQLGAVIGGTPLTLAMLGKAVQNALQVFVGASVAYEAVKDLGLKKPSPAPGAIAVAVIDPPLPPPSPPGVSS